MADYGVEPSTNGYGEDQEMYDGENQNQEYNDYGAEENPMDMEDVPVSQEDAWAVISWVLNSGLSLTLSLTMPFT